MFYEGTTKRCFFRCSKSLFTTVFFILMIASIGRYGVKSLFTAYPEYRNTPYNFASNVLKERPDLYPKYGWVLEWL